MKKSGILKNLLKLGAGISGLCLYSAMASAAPSPLLLSKPIVCDMGIGGNPPQLQVVFKSEAGLTAAHVFDSEGKNELAVVPCTSPNPLKGTLFLCERAAPQNREGNPVTRVRLSFESWGVYADIEGSWSFLGEVVCQKPW